MGDANKILAMRPQCQHAEQTSLLYIIIPESLSHNQIEEMSDLVLLLIDINFNAIIQRAKKVMKSFVWTKILSFAHVM